MLKTPFPALPPSTHTNCTHAYQSTYTKVIVLKVDSFESTIEDEHNFGINNTQEILDFMDSYNPKEYVCVKVNVDCEDVTC